MNTLFTFVILMIIIYAVIDECRNEKSKSKLSIEDMIKGLSPREFEEFICKLYREMGYSCKLTQATNDEGRDVIVKKDGVTTFIECKRYNKSIVGREILQKLIGSCIQKNVYNAIVVTTGKYNTNAINTMKECNRNGVVKLKCYGLNDIINMCNKISKERLMTIL